MMVFASVMTNGDLAVMSGWFGGGGGISIDVE